MAADGRTIDLPAHPSSVALARHLVRDVVSDSGSPELSGDAELLTSEVVTNALVHAGAPIRITARVVGSGVRVEVADGSPHSPIVREYGELAGTGRGLRLLDLLARWGVEETASGKAVWFELGQTRGTGAPTTGPDHSYAGPTGAAPGPDQVEVTLLQVPLLLHAAWQMHAESFLREYLLTQLDDSDDAAAIVAHADASDALALLKEHIPAPELGDDPTSPDGGRHRGPGLGGPARLAGAAQLRPALHAAQRHAGHRPGDRGRRRLPDAHHPAGAARDAPLALLGGGGAGAGRGPPAVVAHEPGPRRSWPCPDGLGRQRRRAVRFGGARRGRHQPDPGRQPGRAQACSATRRETWSGRRLIAIIPERFHQAHLAGFTMHLLSGRGPLLGVTVAVPAVRQDGSELVVELTVRGRATATGRPLFVAELTDVA